MTRWLASAQSDPFDFNPLHDVLDEVIDFELLSAPSSVVPCVVICATSVRVGREEIFTGKRLRAISVMTRFWTLSKHSLVSRRCKAVLAQFGVASKCHADLTFVRQPFSLSGTAGADSLKPHRVGLVVRSTLNLSPSV